MKKIIILGTLLAFSSPLQAIEIVNESSKTISVRVAIKDGDKLINEFGENYFSDDFPPHFTTTIHSTWSDFIKALHYLKEHPKTKKLTVEIEAIALKKKNLLPKNRILHQIFEIKNDPQYLSSDEKIKEKASQLNEKKFVIH